MKHRMHPIDWDWDGDWDGVVKFDYGTKQFVRYVDRNGEHWTPIAPIPLTLILPNVRFYGLVSNE